jgi:hypothetical protein
VLQWKGTQRSEDASPAREGAACRRPSQPGLPGERNNVTDSFVKNQATDGWSDRQKVNRRQPPLIRAHWERATGALIEWSFVLHEGT